MKSYCVKQKKQTECVPGSEQYVQTKNGRNAMKCKCAECGITKFRFVKGGAKQGGAKRGSAKGKGLLLRKRSPFRGIPIIGDILYLD